MRNVKNRVTQSGKEESFAPPLHAAIRLGNEGKAWLLAPRSL
jgi:hypothetical protein